MNPRVELPVTFRSGHRRFAAGAALAAVLAIGAYVLGKGSALSNGFAGFCGIAALVMLLLCLPQASWLRLSESGLEFSNRFRRDFVAWPDIAQFRVANLGRHAIVGWDYVAGHARSRPLQPMASAIAGVDGALPETYGHSGEELARLLNEVRARFPGG